MAGSVPARTELQEIAQRVLREFSRRGLVELGNLEEWKAIDGPDDAPRVVEAGKVIELGAAIHVAFAPEASEPDDSDAVAVTKEGDQVATVLLRPYRSELALLRGFADVLEDLGIGLAD